MLTTVGLGGKKPRTRRECSDIKSRNYCRKRKTCSWNQNSRKCHPKIASQKGAVRIMGTTKKGEIIYKGPKGGRFVVNKEGKRRYLQTAAQKRAAAARARARVAKSKRPYRKRGPRKTGLEAQLQRQQKKLRTVACNTRTRKDVCILSKDCAWDEKSGICYNKATGVPKVALKKVGCKAKTKSDLCILDPNCAWDATNSVCYEKITGKPVVQVKPPPLPLPEVPGAPKALPTTEEEVKAQADAQLKAQQTAHEEALKRVMEQAAAEKKAAEERARKQKEKLEAQKKAEEEKAAQEQAKQIEALKKEEELEQRAKEAATQREQNRLKAEARKQHKVAQTAANKAEKHDQNALAIDNQIEQENEKENQAEKERKRLEEERKRLEEEQKQRLEKEEEPGLLSRFGNWSASWFTSQTAPAVKNTQQEKEVKKSQQEKEVKKSQQEKEDKPILISKDIPVYESLSEAHANKDNLPVNTIVYIKNKRSNYQRVRYGDKRKKNSIGVAGNKSFWTSQISLDGIDEETTTTTTPATTTTPESPVKVAQTTVKRRSKKRKYKPKKEEIENVIINEKVKVDKLIDWDVSKEQDGSEIIILHRLKADDVKKGKYIPDYSFTYRNAKYYVRIVDEDEARRVEAGKEETTVKQKRKKPSPKKVEEEGEPEKIQQPTPRIQKQDKGKEKVTQTFRQPTRRGRRGRRDRKEEKEEKEEISIDKDKLIYLENDDNPAKLKGQIGTQFVFRNKIYQVESSIKKAKEKYPKHERRSFGIGGAKDKVAVVLVKHLPVKKN